MEISRLGPEPGRFLPAGTPGNTPEAAPVPGSGKGSRPGRSPGAPDVPSEAVSVSPEVRLIIALHEAVRTASDVRPEVVAGLKARIEAGRYAVDEFELAKLLVGGNRP